MDSLLSYPPSLLLARRQLPTKPGVYIFKNTSGRVIYVGKAKNLKQRVSSYFQPPVRLGPKTSLLVGNIRELDHIPVTSETEALLLESRLIKKFKPQYNLISKDDKSPYYIHLTKELFPRPVINHQPKNSLAGPFLNSLIPRRILKQFRMVAPFCVAPRPVNRPCFYSHIGLCRPCPGQGDTPVVRLAYSHHITRLRHLLHGQFSRVESVLKKDMLSASKHHDFESAADCRDQLNALDHLRQTPALPDEYLQNPNLVQDTQNESLSALSSILTENGLPVGFLHRLEMYDNAHLSGQNAASAMVVAKDGAIDHGAYRHFKVKYSQGDNDTGMMKEILSRRLGRSDWPIPDLIILDGGVPQLSSVLSLNPAFPVIALAKRLETIVLKDISGNLRQINLPPGHPALRLLQSLRDEAHRFSRRLHHRLRSKSLV